MSHTENIRQSAGTWPYPRLKQFEEILHRCSEKWFRSKNIRPHPIMTYCLEKWEDWPNNIILPEIVGYIKELNSRHNGNPFPLHKYLHHGLSSQAMTFNLFGPLIKRKTFEPIENLLKENGIDIKGKINEGEFEYDDRDVFNDDHGQPSSLDIGFFEDGKPLVFMESKLVEKEFGGCYVFAAGDCRGENPLNDLSQCFLHFIGRKYWDLMEKHGITGQLNNQLICPFTIYYQFFREILFSLEKSAAFVLLCDRRSGCFHSTKERGLIPLMKRFLPDSLKDRISVIFIQDLVEKIKRDGRHEDWIGEFEKKYGMEECL